MSAPQVGTGTAVTFSAATGFLANALSVNHSGMEVADVETTTLATTGGRTYQPGDLMEPGEVEIGLAFDPTVDPPILTTPSPTGNLVITYPGGAGGQWSAAGYMKAFDITAELESRIEATARFKLTGLPDVT